MFPRCVIKNEETWWPNGVYLHGLVEPQPSTYWQLHECQWERSCVFCPQLLQTLDAGCALANRDPPSHAFAINVMQNMIKKKTTPFACPFGSSALFENETVLHRCGLSMCSIAMSLDTLIFHHFSGGNNELIIAQKFMAL